MQVAGALRSGCVLDEVQGDERPGGSDWQRRFGIAKPREGGLAQLPCRGRLAQVMRTFAEEAEAAVASVQAGSRTIPVLVRRKDPHRIGDRETRDVPPRVLDDGGLERDLPVVGHVAKDGPAAPPFHTGAAIG